MAGQTLPQGDYQSHPAADIFPLMSGQEFADLVADIRAHGLREPIILTPDGRILDGRNRYRACVEAGVAPHFETWDGDDPVAYVVSLNLHRRHLDTSQRGLVAGKIATLRLGDNQHTAGSANLPTLTQHRAAELMNVGERTVREARKVLDAGAPEVVAAVERGQVAVSTAAVLTELPKAEQAEIVARGEREILAKAKEIRAAKNEERRAERVEKLAEIARGNTPLVDATPVAFPVVYADPPWRYEHVETESRAIENQYPTMDLAEICALPVSERTTPDAVLFLWATSPKLAEAMRVLDAWGFTYRTCMVWVKDKIGMGYYARQQHELLLIATKGTPPTPAPSDRPASVVIAPRTDHSAKPAVFAELIERMYPSLPKLEMFCRAPRDGWHVWGNQA